MSARTLAYRRVQYDSEFRDVHQAARVVYISGGMTSPALSTLPVYSLSNSSGLTGGAWDATYSSLLDALVALRREMGWSTYAVGDQFCAEGATDNCGETYAVCVYETRAERDADQEGADAPRVSWCSAKVGRRGELIAALADLDDGTGTLGTVVDQALAEDAGATAAQIREIVVEAVADARVEAHRTRQAIPVIREAD